MSASTLMWGVLGLFLLPLLAAPLGGIGTVELTVWLALLVIWVLWWVRSRRPETPRR
jgi:hypothetical protein